MQNINKTPQPCIGQSIEIMRAAVAYVVIINLLKLSQFSRRNRTIYIAPNSMIFLILFEFYILKYFFYQT